MKTIPNWLAAVALSAAVTSAVPAFGQAGQPSTIGGAQRAQQDDQKQTREERQEAQRDRKEQQRADRAERKQANQEREQLKNMPRPVRMTLRGETANATEVDYYREKGEQGQGPTFGAKFTSAEGRNIDLRVDREGKVVSRTDLTAQTASAQAPATPAPATPAPATPGQPAPTPAPGTTTPPPATGQPGATASKEAPPSGDPIYRRLEPNEVPANVKAVLDREAQGGKEVDYYRSKYGRRLSYTVSYNDPSGRERDVVVGDDGTILSRHEDDERDAAAASAREKANTPAAGSASGQQQYGRVELNALPKTVQTQFTRLTEGGSNIKYYTAKYGQQSAFLADFRSKDGKQHKVYVDESGKILSQKAEGGDSK